MPKNNEKEIKKYQPETVGESSTTAIQRKEQERQIVKNFDTLLNLVPTDEQLTGDEKFKNYFSEKEEYVKRRNEEETKRREIWERKFWKEPSEELKEEKKKNGFWTGILYEKTENIENKTNTEAKNEWIEWMGPERAEERKREVKKMIAFYGKEKFAEDPYGWVLPQFSGYEHDGDVWKYGIWGFFKEKEFENNIEKLAKSEESGQIKKFTSTAKNELQAIKNQFSDFIKAQNDALEFRGKQLEDKEIEITKAKEDNLQIKKQGENELRNKAKEFQQQYSKEKSTWNENLTQNQNELNRVKKNKEQLEQEKKKLEKNIEILNSEKQIITNNYNQAEKKCQEYERIAAETAERIKSQVLLPDPKDIDLKKWREKCYELSQINEVQKGVIEVNNIMVNEKEQQIIDLTSEISQLQAKIQELEKRISELEAELSSGKIDLETANKTIEYRDQEITNLQEWQKEREDKISELEIEKLNLQNDQKTFEGKILELENIISTNELLLTQNGENMQTWIDREEKERNQRIAFEQQNIDLDGDNKKFQKKISDLQNQKQQLEKELDQATEAKKDLENNLKKAERVKRWALFGNAVQGFSKDILGEKWGGRANTTIQLVSGATLLSEMGDWTYDIWLMTIGIGVFFICKFAYRLSKKKLGFGGTSQQGNSPGINVVVNIPNSTLPNKVLGVETPNQQPETKEQKPETETNQEPKKEK